MCERGVYAETCDGLESSQGYSSTPPPRPGRMGKMYSIPCSPFASGLLRVPGQARVQIHFLTLPPPLTKTQSLSSLCPSPSCLNRDTQLGPSQATEI